MSSHTYYCCADACSSSSRDHTTFFRFPKDPLRCQQWKDLLGFTGDHKYATLSPEEAHKRIRICAAHFDDQSFTSSGKRLLNTAVPSKLLSKDSKILDCIKQEYEVPSCSKSHTDSKYTQTLRDTRYVKSTQTYVDQKHAETSTFCIMTDASVQSGFYRERVEDVACQTASCLFRNTPREQGLKRKLEETQYALKVFKRRAKTTLPDVLKFLDEHYPHEATMLIRNQLLVLDKASNKARYSDEFKHFAFTLFLLGPKAYQKLSKYIRLPSPSTLKRATRYWNICPGFNEFMFKIIELRVPSMSEMSKDCVLCIDEMSIKSNLFYNLSKDVIVGFEDLHNRKSTNIATSVLVVMARGISHNWKQPISYFFTQNSTCVEDLKEIIVGSIRKLKSIGINVLAVTSDQGPNFYKLVKSCFKLTYEKPYFYVDDCVIFYLFDVPHLLKSTRNNFYSYMFCLEDGVTMKSHLESMYYVDKEKQYRLAARLTDDHINPNNIQKMKVKLASQVFSHSVAVAMHTYIDFEKIPADAKVTANFIENMNKLSDILNSSNLETCQSFMGTREQIAFLNRMDALFSNLKVVNKTGQNVTLKFIYGWRLTISSILKLWDILRDKKYKSLSTRNLNQDCLGTFFSQIRYTCGNARNPTAIQFCRAFKILFTSKYFEEKDGSNCLDDVSDILLALTPEIIKRSEFLQVKPCQNIALISTISTKDYENLIIEEGNALVYLGGYFLRKCLLKHSCDICLNYSNVTHSDKSAILCELKAYEGGDGTQGPYSGLTVPPKSFTDYLISLENILISNFITSCTQDAGVGCTMINEFSKVRFTHPCPNFPCEYLVSLYTRVRIFCTLKFANGKIKSQSRNKELPTLTILQNL